MRRLAGLLLLFVAAMPFVQAQDKQTRGVMTLTFGHVRDVDGKMRSVAGLKIPWTAKPIPIGGPQTKPATGDRVDTDVYRCDGGPGTYFYSDPGFPMPSACDDTDMLAIGVNKPFRILGVGYKVDSWQTVILRWQTFETYTADRGAGVSAFDPFPPVNDFGGFFTFDPGRFPDLDLAYYIEFDISVVGATIQEHLFYFASQVRAPIATGEGAFIEDIHLVFSGPGGAQIGTTNETFWYDQDLSPPLGVYDETEIETLAQNPGEIYGLLLRIAVNSSAAVFSLTPTSFSVFPGRHLSGDFTDLAFSDDFYVVADSYNVAADFDYPVGITVDAVSPTTNINSMSFSAEHRSEAIGTECIIELYRFGNNTWTEVFRGLIGTTDTVFNYTLGGNPQAYVQAGTRKVRARFQYRAVAVDIDPFKIWLDRVNWVVVRP